MHNPHDIAEKARKIAEELTQIMNMPEESVNLDQFPDTKDFVENSPLAGETLGNLTNPKFYNLDKSNKKEHVNELIRAINAAKHRRRQRQKVLGILLKFSAAAAIFLAIYTYNQPDMTHDPESVLAFNKKDVSKPMLILGNGTEVDLTNMESSIDVEDRYEIDRDGKNKLSYKNTMLGDSLLMEYNTVVVPAKFIYYVTLSDGTEVILNANSQLKYPVKFNSNKREIYLTGEGYFNVKKDKRPFVVTVFDKVNIKVYGTIFNINSYDKEMIRTTLIEGRVGASIIDNPELEEIILKPQQQSIINLSQKTSAVKSIDVDRSLAWISGYFRYDSERLSDILSEFSIWYNIDFVFENKAHKDIVMTALFERSAELEDILTSIENAIDVKFKKEGGYYVIKQQ